MNSDEPPLLREFWIASLTPLRTASSPEVRSRLLAVRRALVIDAVVGTEFLYTCELVVGGVAKDAEYPMVRWAGTY